MPWYLSGMRIFEVRMDRLDTWFLYVAMAMIFALVLAVGLLHGGDYHRLWWVIWKCTRSPPLGVSFLPRCWLSATGALSPNCSGDRGIFNHPAPPGSVAALSAGGSVPSLHVELVRGRWLEQVSIGGSSE